MCIHQRQTLKTRSEHLDWIFFFTNAYIPSPQQIHSFKILLPNTFLSWPFQGPVRHARLGFEILGAFVFLQTVSCEPFAVNLVCIRAAMC